MRDQVADRLQDSTKKFLGAGSSVADGEQASCVFPAFRRSMAIRAIARVAPTFFPGKSLVNESDSFIERVRLHQFATNQGVQWRSIPQMLRKTNVRFLQGRVLGLDA